MSTPPPPPPPPGFGQPPPQPPYGGQQPFGGPPQPPYGGQPQYGGGTPGGFPTPPPGYGAPQAYQPYQGYAPAYAGFGARLGGFLIDMLIQAVFSIPGIIVFFAGPRHYVDCTVNGEDGICHVPTGGTIGLAALLWIAGVVLFLVFYCRLLGKGQTWGQKAVNVRCVDINTGQPIGTGRAVGRFFAMYLSYIVCYLGFLWELWDPKKQTWHDKLVSSIVIKNG